MPGKSYCSVNVPVGLYDEVNGVVKGCSDLGYRSVTAFVLEDVRVRLVDLGECAGEMCAMKLWRKTDKISSKDTKKLYAQLMQNGVSEASAKNVIKLL